jgi:hypothetical protein
LIRIPEWSGDIGPYYGSPYAPKRIQMKPSSYSGLLSGSEHGSLSDMEPADRAPDRPARWDASVNTTVETLQPYMKDWCEKCCMKIQAIEAEDARRQSKSRERSRLWEALMLSLP